jgi:hypothetical protein
LSEAVNYAIVRSILKSYGFPFREREIDGMVVITVYFYVSDMTDGEPVLTFNINKSDGQVQLKIESGCLYLEPIELYEVEDAVWNIFKRIKSIHVLYNIGDP